MGLSGISTINLCVTPNDSRSAVSNSQATSSADSGPSLFAALKEQLGLKLKSSKFPSMCA
jgi:uncharacterized protein (TIGR03435 family)